MDKALVFRTKDCRLESCQDHLPPVSFGPGGHLFETNNAAQGTEPQARDHGQPSSGPVGLRVGWRRVGHSRRARAGQWMHFAAASRKVEGLIPEARACLSARRRPRL